MQAPTLEEEYMSTMGTALLEQHPLGAGGIHGHLGHHNERAAAELDGCANANISAVEWKSPPPAQVGSRVAFVARFLGRRLEYTYELAEVVPGERLVMRTLQGPFPMETTYLWTATADGSTQMTLRNRGTPAGFSKLVAPFMAQAMRRANRKDLAKLKSILEAG